MKYTINFVTGNKGKFEIARDIFDQYNLPLKQLHLDPPEIQSSSVEDISLYSAKHAASMVNEPIITSDVGYYIQALNGFPGPYIKYINETLSPDDLLNLMHGQPNRTLTIKECLAYYNPHSDESMTFICEHNATVSTEKAGSGSSIDQIMVLEGFTKTRGSCSQEEIQVFFKKTLKVYADAAAYLSKK